MSDLPPLSRRSFIRLSAAAALAPSALRRELLGGSADRRLANSGAPWANHASAHSPLAPRPSSTWPRYANVLVIDALASPGPFNVPDSQARPLTPEMVRNAAASGITAVNVTVNAGGTGVNAFVNTVKSMAWWQRELDAHPNAFTQVKTHTDLARAKRERKLGLIFGFQDAAPIEDDLTRLQAFHDMGVRIIQLTYNGRNLVGDGCLEPANAGLSAYGRQVVARMNELGILVDLSHCGQRTTADAIAVSSKPVAITHSGCAALVPLPRNKRDEELRAMAEKGGVVGIYLMPFLVAKGAPRADDVIRHLEHAIKVCGEDHVGIGSDQSITPIDATPEYWANHRRFIDQRRRLGISAPGEDPDVLVYVEELNTARRMEMIADRLAARGHSDARIEKVLGGNFSRMMGEVWR
jgi:membrane dipeptidase